MDKFKYQIIGIVLCFLIGGFLGHLFTAGEKDKEIKKLSDQHKIELTTEINLSKQRIGTLNEQLVKLNEQHKSDSASIVMYKDQIAKHAAETEQKRKEAAKLNKDEKKKFIIDYYKSN